MSRQTVRSGLVDFFQGIPGLNRVFPAPPKIITGDDFYANQPAGTMTGSTGSIMLTASRERRIAMGGPHSGKKLVTYDAELWIFAHSVEAKAEDAMAFFDTVVDATLDLIRSDRLAGMADTTIYQVGEEKLQFEGSVQPVVTPDGAVEIWGVVRFDVSEVLTT